MRSTSDIINQAIDESRGGKLLIYAYTVLILIVGIGLIIWSLSKNEPLLAVAGVGQNALLWPAVRAAERIRNLNIALRMLEVPLGKAKTSEDAANMLRQVFERHFMVSVVPSSPSPKGELTKADARTQ